MVRITRSELLMVIAAIFTIALAAFIGVFLIQRQTRPSVIQPSQADSASKETPEPLPKSNPIYEIAFVRNGDIYICTRNGENLKRLTTDGKNAFPLWSFNGEWIAFLKAEPPVRGIAGTTLCVINVDDGNVRRLITEGGASLYPVSWLPDDSGVIYNFTQLETEGLPGRFDVVRLDGSKIIWAPLERWRESAERMYPVWNGFGGALAFSPDFDEVLLTGSHRSYEESGYPILDLYHIDYDGSDLETMQVLDNTWIYCLRWHPVEDMFLFSATRNVYGEPITERGVWLASDDGDSVRHVVENTAASFNGMDWVDGADRIIYQQTSADYPNFEHPEAFGELSSMSSIWIMNTDGTGRRVILDNACHPNFR